MNQASINLFALFLGLTVSIPVFAQSPKVSVSLAPLHSLVAQLGQGVFEPELIYSIEQSPHSAALKPSQLEHILNADLLIWVDESLEQSLGRVINQRKPKGLVLQLHEENGALGYAQNLALLPNRASLFESAEHSNEHDQASHLNHEEHDHGKYDPHFWLSPDNALQFSRAVYQQLNVIDPENRTLYKENLEQLEADLQRLQTELNAATLPIKAAPFIVFHDGFQYFEHAFALNGIGAVVLIPDQPPGPKTMSNLIKAAQKYQVGCLFSEPQYDKKYLTFIQKKLTGARVEVIDTLGSQLTPGTALYRALLTQLATNMVNCLESKK